MQPLNMRGERLAYRLVIIQHPDFPQPMNWHIQIAQASALAPVPPMSQKRALHHQRIGSNPAYPALCLGLVRPA
jgi:hypothetical protein